MNFIGRKFISDNREGVNHIEKCDSIRKITQGMIIGLIRSEKRDDWNEEDIGSNEEKMSINIQGLNK
jgi:hypothetical protein